MKNFSVLIVEDSEHFFQELSNHLNELILCKITLATTLKDSLSLIYSQNFDLIFLDIMLGKDNGLDLIHATKTTPIIITSSHPNFAVETYEFENIKDFILKPISKGRLNKAISRCLLKPETLENNSHSFFFKVGRKMQKINFENLEYIMAYGIYTKVYFNENYLLVNDNISYLESNLPPNIFIRIHKSYIVNLQKITSIDANHVFIQEKPIPIGLTFRSKLQVLLGSLPLDKK
jgi:DNA-binding LytR/AlgR family response regulator